jgi:hypothetical protein
VSGFDVDRSVFGGMSPAVLQNALDNAQTALIALLSGQQVVRVSYGEGAGTKHVEYKAPQIGGLVQLINELQACLGLRRRARRGFGVSF